MDIARPLRTALVVNAIFSLTSGGLMIFKTATISKVLGIQAPLILQAIGIGLLIFAADLLFQATRRRISTLRALYASIADFLWVFGTFAIQLLFPDMFSEFGNGLVAVVAIAVLAFGIWQIWAIDHCFKLSTNGQYRVCLRVQTNAPADAMWTVVSRLENIKRYSSSLVSSVVLGEKTTGVGALRMCKNRDGKHWAEECVAFNKGRSLVLRFVTEAPDFPFPVQKMTGGWEIVPCDRGSQVVVWWELVPKPSYLGFVILPMLASQVERDIPKIVQNMAAEALGKSPEFEEQDRAITHLLPEVC